MTDDELYSGIAKETTDSTKLALTKSAFIAHNVNPDQHAKNVKDAVKQGIPRQLAVPAEGPVNADKLNSLVADYHKIAETSPVTATHLSNPEVAKVADHEHMSTFEKLTQTLQDYTEPLGHMIMSVPQSAIEGYRGIAAVAGSMSAGRSFDQALNAGIDSLTEKTLTKNFNPDLKTDTSKKVEKLLALPFEKWSEAGEWAVDHTTGGPTQKAFERTLWEFLPFVLGAKKSPKEALAHQMAEGRKSAANATRIKMLTDSAKESELRNRDPEMHKDFVHDTTAEMEPINILTGHLDNLVSKAGTTTEEVLSDPVAYHEAKLNGDEKVPMSLADLITPDSTPKPPTATN